MKAIILDFGDFLFVIFTRISLELQFQLLFHISIAHLGAYFCEMSL